MLVYKLSHFWYILTLLDITIYSTFLFCALIVPSLTQINVILRSDILLQIRNRSNDKTNVYKISTYN